MCPKKPGWYKTVSPYELNLHQIEIPPPHTDVPMPFFDEKKDWIVTNPSSLKSSCDEKQNEEVKWLLRGAIRSAECKK